jgi:hypothetical protein
MAVQTLTSCFTIPAIGKLLPARCFLFVSETVREPHLIDRMGCVHVSTRSLQHFLSTF